MLLQIAISCLAMVFGREPSYRNELSFTTKPVALNEPITCVPKTRVDIAFLDDPTVTGMPEDAGRRSFRPQGSYAKSFTGFRKSVFLRYTVWTSPCPLMSLTAMC